MQVETIKIKVVDLIRSYRGQKIEISGDKLIGRDIGLIRGDSVQFQDEIEEIFGVDLAPLTNAHAVIPKPGWFDRLLGQNRGAYTDFTVDELVDFISRNAA